jgi:glycosyltransferase involved in cell wall biosynthesis
VGDVVALRAAIIGLLADPERRAEMGRSGRRIVVEEYSVERQARHYVELYERILESQSR